MIFISYAEYGGYNSLLVASSSRSMNFSHHLTGKKVITDIQIATTFQGPTLHIVHKHNKTFSVGNKAIKTQKSDMLNIGLRNVLSNLNTTAATARRIPLAIVRHTSAQQKNNISVNTRSTLLVEGQKTEKKKKGGLTIKPNLSKTVSYSSIIQKSNKLSNVSNKNIQEYVKENSIWEYNNSEEPIEDEDETKEEDVEVNQQQGEKRIKRLPHVLIIGAKKCGTGKKTLNTFKYMYMH